MSGTPLGFTQVEGKKFDSVDAHIVNTDQVIADDSIAVTSGDIEVTGDIRSNAIVIRPPSAALAGIPTRLVADPAPATAATLLGGYLRCDTALGAFNITTDTAVNIIAAMPNAAVGDYFDVVIAELPGGAGNAVTLVGGVGVTVIGTPTVTGVTGIFRFNVQTATTIQAERIDGA